MKAVLLGPESCPYAKILQSKLATTWDLICLDDCEMADSYSTHFESADVLISIRFDRTLPAMPALKLLQVPSAGTNSIRFDDVPSGVSVCNAYGHQIAVAEYSILAMLACAHDLLRIHNGFVKGHWCRSETAIHETHSELHGKTVCIIGLGKIGVETARRARSLGMYVIGCNRTKRNTPDIDETADLSAAMHCVSRADFVIVACAHTEETNNMVNASVLAAMKSTAFIINVARAGLIDEAGLYRALQTRSIAGAVLDVWYRYPSRESPHPKPSDFPFYELDNVIMTPHVSGWTDGMVERRWSEVARNLDRLGCGRALANVVAVGRAR